MPFTLRGTAGLAAFAVCIACAGTPDAKTEAAQAAGGQVGASAGTSATSGGDSASAGAAPAGAGAGGASVAMGPKSAGCGKAGPMTGVFTKHWMVGGVDRTAEVNIPTDYNPDAPLPLVFVLHHVGATSQIAASYGLQTAMSVAGDRAIFVYPQGLAGKGGTTGWSVGSCTNNKDLDMYDAAVSDFESNYCIQTNRLFAAGFSFGADMTNTLGCCRGDAIRAIAPSSGSLYASGCGDHSPAFRMSDGTADGSYSQDDFKKAVTRAKTANHCTDTLTDTPPTPCQAYSGCDQPVLWCVYKDMPHQLPDHWPTDVWAFFASFK